MNCPFLYTSEECQGDMFSCQHPDGSGIRIGERNYKPIIPIDCPLKKESITVSFKIKTSK